MCVWERAGWGIKLSSGLVVSKWEEVERAKIGGLVDGWKDVGWEHTSLSIYLAANMTCKQQFHINVDNVKPLVYLWLFWCLCSALFITLFSNSFCLRKCLSLFLRFSFLFSPLCQLNTHTPPPLLSISFSFAHKRMINILLSSLVIQQTYDSPSDGYSTNIHCRLAHNTISILYLIWYMRVEEEKEVVEFVFLWLKGTYVDKHGFAQSDQWKLNMMTCAGYHHINTYVSQFLAI